MKLVELIKSCSSDSERALISKAICFNIGAMLCELDFISLKDGRKSIYYSKMLKTYKDESFALLNSDKLKDSEVNLKETFNRIFK